MRPYRSSVPGFRGSSAKFCMASVPFLLSLRHLLEAARRMGLKADAIHSENLTEHSRIESDFLHDKVDILLITPERFANQRFSTQVLAPVAGKITLLVIDEAHCISDWGHDFRPHYRLLERIVKTLPPNLRLLATTATANDRVMKDLASVLGPNLDVSRGDLNRKSLTLQSISMPSQADRLAWLAEKMETLHGHGIIYTLTKRDANRVADWLKSRGLNVEAYTGDTGPRREALEQALLKNEVKALIGTTALSMNGTYLSGFGLNSTGAMARSRPARPMETTCLERFCSPDPEYFRLSKCHSL